MWPVWGFPRPPRWNTGCPPFTQSHTLTEPLWTWAPTDLAGSHPASESLAGTRCATSVSRCPPRPPARIEGRSSVARPRNNCARNSGSSWPLHPTTCGSSGDRLVQRPARLALQRSRACLGIPVLPALTGEPDQDRWPAAGVWGDEEFSRRSAQALVDAGVRVEDAVEIRHLLFADLPFKNPRLLDERDFGYLLSAAEVGLEELRRWTGTTVPMRFVADLVKLDITADRAREMREHDGLTDFDLFDRLRRDAWARATG